MRQSLRPTGPIYKVGSLLSTGVLTVERLDNEAYNLICFQQYYWSGKSGHHRHDKSQVKSVRVLPWGASRTAGCAECGRAVHSDDPQHLPLCWQRRDERHSWNPTA